MGVKRVTEKAFQRQVMQYAHLHGWKTAHFRPGMMRDGKWVTPVAGDGKGFPDTVFVKTGLLVFAELKVGKNKATPEQLQWLAVLSTVPNVEAHLWRPEDWSDIEKVLGNK